VLGETGPGRRRISWLKNLRTWLSKTTTELFWAAVNKSSLLGRLPIFETNRHLE
jgi:hypothetical protein